MMLIEDYIKSNNLTQAKAAKLMSVDQPRISKLLKGNINLFTIDMLIQMLERVDIHLVITKAA